MRKYKDSRSPWLTEERKAILDKLFRHYRTPHGRGKVAWTQAMKDNPTWPTILDWEGNGKPYCYQGISRMVGRAERNGEPEPQPQPAPQAKVVMEPAAEPWLNLCPQCGLNLKILRTAYAVAQKHSRR